MDSFRLCHAWYPITFRHARYIQYLRTQTRIDESLEWIPHSLSMHLCTEGHLCLLHFGFQSISTNNPSFLSRNYASYVYFHLTYR